MPWVTARRTEGAAAETPRARQARHLLHRPPRCRWVIYEHACKFGCEGIVAKRSDIRYQSGRSKAWLKVKNPKSPAAIRIEEGTF
ncbi:MAG: hypothetical protein JO141_12055 [Bradyrhizobium sp.]|nr:hypothetical protein [Bradyrhizobium sp.]